MTTNNHNANHERPPADRERRSVLGENLLTIITIVGVVGNEGFSCRERIRNKYFS